MKETEGATWKVCNGCDLLHHAVYILCKCIYNSDKNHYNFLLLSVDKLIQNIGDPRVAEKLRIYRLVEEQFNEVQAQVQKEVQNNKCLVRYIIKCFLTNHTRSCNVFLIIL